MKDTRRMTKRQMRRRIAELERQVKELQARQPLELYENGRWVPYSVPAPMPAEPYRWAPYNPTYYYVDPPYNPMYDFVDPFPKVTYCDHE